MVELTHKTTGRTITVSASQARVLTRSGWETKQPLFDPADHTVTEVLDYLAIADETEQARVLEAETDGKNRSSLTG